MAYVAVTGGQDAIEESLSLLKLYRTEGEQSIDVNLLKESLKLLIDRVMSEAGFYAPDYAALCLKQSEGSIEEAVFLLRAYRSTLPRRYQSQALDGRNMRVIRRISAAFKDIEGGQILGPSYDYTHRLIDFSLRDENEADIRKFRSEYLNGERSEDLYCKRVSDSLKKEGLVSEPESAYSPLDDVTEHLIKFPVSRSAKLQTLARADGGFISGLAYSSLRGFGAVHPTVGELRTGYLEVQIPYPLNPDETISLGEILVTEVESLIPANKKNQQDKNELALEIGYGAVFGRNENKAIAISILDKTLENTEGSSPANNQEFVLLHGDSLEMNGFISHLKLPHYVTFQSKLDSIRNTRKEENNECD